MLPALQQFGQLSWQKTIENKPFAAKITYFQRFFYHRNFFAENKLFLAAFVCHMKIKISYFLAVFLPPKIRNYFSTLVCCPRNITS
jgi:hypothetical protein